MGNSVPRVYHSSCKGSLPYLSRCPGGCKGQHSLESKCKCHFVQVQKYRLFLIFCEFSNIFTGLTRVLLIAQGSKILRIYSGQERLDLERFADCWYSHCSQTISSANLPMALTDNWFFHFRRVGHISIWPIKYKEIQQKVWDVMWPYLYCNI